MSRFKYSDYSTPPSLSTFANPITLQSPVNFLISDQFYVDDISISASELTLSISKVDINIAIGSQYFLLKGFTQNKISSTNFTFADSSKLIIGDDTTDTNQDDSLILGDILRGTDFDDYIDGMAGSDTVYYDRALSAITADLSIGLSSRGGGFDKLINIENITGSDYNDNLTGLDSGSRIDGGLGIDTLTGGQGNDTYIVTAADVIIDAGTTDTDTVESNSDYVLAAGLENLTLLRGASIGIGNDVANTLRGNSSNNTLDGGLGADILIGGAGNDDYLVDDTNDRITEAPREGTDTVWSIVDFTLTGTGVNDVENLHLTGQDAINGTGNLLSNIIYANSGDNILNGGDGQAKDTLSYQFGAISGVYVNILPSSNIQDTGGSVDMVGSGHDTISGFENLIGSHYNDSLTGNAESNKLNGREGNDILVGSGGNDTLDGGEGNDSMTGGEGNDTYYIDAGDGNDSVGTNEDMVIEDLDQGTDTVLSYVSSYTLNDNVEKLTLIGTARIGVGNVIANTISGNSSDNILNGVAGADIISGGDGKDTIDGGDDNDVITGGTGRDVVTTGSGNDIIKFGIGTTDTVCTTTSIDGVDWYRDLTSADQIDLKVAVTTVAGISLTGVVNKSTFVADMNTLLSGSTGFRVTSRGIDVAIVTATSGDLKNYKFLAVDLDQSDTFTDSDFVIEITGTTITSLTTAIFI